MEKADDRVKKAIEDRRCRGEVIQFLGEGLV